MDRPHLSVAFAPSKDVVAHARVAEELGYRRVWLYDSPAVYGDVWMALGRLAEQTRNIGLGTAVAVPSLRHPAVTASAIATVEDLSPGRLTVAFGTGYTARLALGRKPMRWSDLTVYVRQVRALLDGEVVTVDGAPCQMVHSPGWAPPRPIRTPLWVAPSGPKGFAAARELGSPGVILTGLPPENSHTASEAALLAYGTVVRPGENHTSGRLVEAAGPWFAAAFHAVWEMRPAALDHIPGGPEWREALLASRPENERHLAVHEGHATTLTDRDRAGIRAAGPAILHSGWTGDPEAVRARAEQAAKAGVTEIVYTPAGPDIPGELEAFKQAVA
jgi:5,10-methylenetetrahydromethanopterin reductase